MRLIGSSLEKRLDLHLVAVAVFYGLPVFWGWISFLKYLYAITS
jgi:hypothetical protein